jgi:hypothetical protein
MVNPFGVTTWTMPSSADDVSMRAMDTTTANISRHDPSSCGMA